MDGESEIRVEEAEKPGKAGQQATVVGSDRVADPHVGGDPDPKERSESAPPRAPDGKTAERYAG